ncbi:putative lrr receptor-like serine/threonine-protein kinase [Quercus suber]|uniref:Lrr receptor-like serine/threonine-protein kinase n=1 Tax=Quercus suber TaxID=58331 RepID=A0AAW0JAY9_QUESU
MANGNLHQHLSVTNTNVLTWNERLHIAVDAAHAFGNFNKKSDVYIFGIILFELITGRASIVRGPVKNSHILDWVNPLIERGDVQNIVDPRLEGEFNTSSA